jgi:hypothetical protein
MHFEAVKATLQNDHTVTVMSGAAEIEKGDRLAKAGCTHCAKARKWRQASRRSWRIGQHRHVVVKFLTYKDMVQETCRRLMARKLLVALAREGKFSTEGLQAVGDEDMLMAMARELVTEKRRLVNPLRPFGASFRGGKRKPLERGRNQSPRPRLTSNRWFVVAHQRQRLSLCSPLERRSPSLTGGKQRAGFPSERINCHCSDHEPF